MKMKDQFEFDKHSQQIKVRRFYYGKRKEKIFLQLEEGLKHFVHNSKGDNQFKILPPIMGGGATTIRGKLR